MFLKCESQYLILEGRGKVNQLATTNFMFRVLLPLLFSHVLAMSSFAMGLEIKPAQKQCSELTKNSHEAPTQAISRLINSQAVRGSQDIAWAWLSSPTIRYPHTALGSTTHAASIHMQLRGGRITTYNLPIHRVFEDLIPRLIDLDKDGKDELILIESDALRGSALVVFGMQGETLVELARSPHTGSTFRWLNPVGVADFDGDGKLDIAAVTTPHIGGTLTLYHYRPPLLAPFAKAMDVSNHKMGSTEQQLAVIVQQSNNRPTILVPDMSLKALHALRWQANGQWMELSDVMPLPSKIERLTPTKNGACALLSDHTWWSVILTHGDKDVPH